MVSFLTLAFATVASASTFYSAPPPPAYSAPPPAVSSSVSEQVTVVTLTSFTSVIAKGPEPTQPAVVVTSVPGVTDTGIMSVVSSTSVGISSFSSDYVNLSSELSRAGNNLTAPASTLTEIPVVVVPSNMSTSTVVVTIPASNTTAHHTATGSVSVTPTPTTVPVNAGRKVQVSVALGMFALIMGVLGA